MKRKGVICLLFALILLLTSCSQEERQTSFTAENKIPTAADISSIPPFSDSPYVILQDNIPSFTEEEITAKSFESYEDLDTLGRCGTAFSSIGKDLMPTEDRGSIGQVKPSGWHTVKYDTVDGKYLYNRCHLIGFQLAGENANEKNLITGTRYMNVEGMLPFENMVADYVKETGNHVMYRVNPVFLGEELVARGVIMEGYSVEDKGEGISFHIYCYNAQPGIVIDYATGESALTEDGEKGTAEEKGEYILNTNSKKIHKENCSSVKDISPKNKKNYKGSLSDLFSQGYQKCKNCF